MSAPSKNSTFKLYYFNLKSLVEPIRFLFAYGGIVYEDIRIEHIDWPALKSSMPMGQLPVLEVDGRRVHQSLAISRYVAKLVGLAGADDWERLQIDSVVDTVDDIRQKIAAVYFEDEVAKAKKKEILVSETIPFYFGKLDELAKENNGYLAASKLSYADFVFTNLIDVVRDWAGKDLLSKYANLQKVLDNVYALDTIKTWMSKRPNTEM